MRTRALLAALAAFAVACPEAASPPPFGFGPLPAQRFRISTDERMQVDGEDVQIQRIADVRLVNETQEGGRFELVLYLDRYYLSVRGAPGGDTELSISEAGLITRGGPSGELVLSPEEAAPGGGTIGQLLDKPVGGVFVNAGGEMQGSVWQSYDPILSGIRLIDWVLFSLPSVGGAAPASWDGSRELPGIGKYVLGIELPLRYESRIDADGDTVRVRSSGVAQRSSLRIAPGLEGAIQLDQTAEARLDLDGRVLGSRVELSMRFEGSDGSQISSLHRFELACRDCGEPEDSSVPVNPHAEEPDTTVQ
jgi:hypothetical protein